VLARREAAGEHGGVIVPGTTARRWRSHLADNKRTTDRLVSAIDRRDHGVASLSTAIKAASASQFLIVKKARTSHDERSPLMGVIVTSRIGVGDETLASTEATRHSPTKALAGLPPTGIEMLANSLQAGRERSLASHAKIGRSATDTDVEEAIEQHWQTLGQSVDSDKNYGLEFKALDVTNIEDTNFELVANIPAVPTSDNADVLRRQSMAEGADQSIDALLTIHENRDRRKAPGRRLDLHDAFGKPTRESVAGAILCQ
jgi:hypothetical protein